MLSFCDLEILNRRKKEKNHCDRTTSQFSLQQYFVSPYFSHNFFFHRACVPVSKLYNIHLIWKNLVGSYLVFVATTLKWYASRVNVRALKEKCCSQAVVSLIRSLALSHWMALVLFLDSSDGVSALVSAPHSLETKTLFVFVLLSASVRISVRSAFLQIHIIWREKTTTTSNEEQQQEKIV